MTPTPEPTVVVAVVVHSPVDSPVGGGGAVFVFFKIEELPGHPYLFFVSGYAYGEEFREHGTHRRRERTRT